jgi:hypothetical protein
MLRSTYLSVFRRILVQTHQIQISNGRDNVHEIRNALFAFPEVLDVFITGRQDALVVVCSGRPRPGDWLRALRAAGYDPPPRQRAAAVDDHCVRAEPSDRPPHLSKLSLVYYAS